MRRVTSTTDLLERQVATAAGGVAAIAVASRQAALTLAVLNLAEAGDHLVASRSLRPDAASLCTHTLPHFGIRTRFVDLRHLADVAASIDQQTRALYYEAVGTASHILADIAALARLAHDFNLPLLVDDSLAPRQVMPLQHGADIVVHRASRWSGGTDDEGGFIVDAGRFNWGATARFRRLYAEPEPAYDGLRFADAFSDVGGLNIAFTARLRAVLLPPFGAGMASSIAASLLQAFDTATHPPRLGDRGVFDTGCAA